MNRRFLGRIAVSLAAVLSLGLGLALPTYAADEAPDAADADRNRGGYGEAIAGAHADVERPLGDLDTEIRAN